MTRYLDVFSKLVMFLASFQIINDYNGKSLTIFNNSKNKLSLYTKCQTHKNYKENLETTKIWSLEATGCACKSVYEYLLRLGTHNRMRSVYHKSTCKIHVGLCIGQQHNKIHWSIDTKQEHMLE